MRERLSNRRAAETITFDHAYPSSGPRRYHATVGYYDDGRVGEIFLATSKTGTDMEINVKDSAMLLSLYLQQGGRLEDIRETFLREENGAPSGPLAALVDILTGHRTWLRWNEQPAAILHPPALNQPVIGS